MSVLKRLMLAIALSFCSEGVVAETGYGTVQENIVDNTR